jgi:serine/threonine protein kinase
MDDIDLDLDQTIRGFVVGQKVFDRYTIKKVLGRGGMGVVWLASDEKLERDVALKFLPELLVLDAASLDDLKRETKRNLELTHQHIVRVYDFAQDDRSAAISMEYVDGPTLSALRVERENKVLETTELEPIVQQACAALEYAHVAAGIVHRDLKPANLMMNSRGELKITDFGIARSLSESISMLTMKKTSGTLIYMSPQQLDGERASALDDIYSLGATIYELLASKPPFYSGGVDKQIHEKKPVSIEERRKELGIVSSHAIPAHWETTIAACLAKNPADRPQSARELAERLTGVPLTGVFTAAPPTVVKKEPSPNVTLPPPPPPPPGPSQSPVAATESRPLHAVRWWQIAAVLIAAAVVALTFGRLKALSTDLFNMKPKQGWARSVMDAQLNASFNKAATPVRFLVKQLLIQSEGSGLASVDASGTAATTEALYAEAAPDDPALQTKLGQLQTAEQQVATLRNVAGIEIPPFKAGESVFVKEITPAGQNASFHLQLEVERSDHGWRVKRTTAAELSPSDSFKGKAISSFGSGAAILGTDRARTAQAELSHRIDEYLARIDDAQKGAVKRFALAGRDARGNPLFPADHAAVGEHFPETRMRVLTADELQLLSDPKLQYAINEIYARHGAVFDREISSVFRKFPWYQPQADVTLQEVEASLSSIETQNVKMLGLVRSAKHEQTVQHRVSRERSRESTAEPQEHTSTMQKAKDAADIFSKMRGMGGFLPGRP